LSGRRAELILLKMQELHEEGRMRVPPSFGTFKKVLDCWANTSEAGAAQRAEDLLSLAEKLYGAGDTNMRPDLEGYISVITAWSSSYASEAPERIQKHLTTIKKRRAEGDTIFKMNDRIYAALIQAYANSGRENSASTALSIFEATPEDMRTTPVYNALIQAQGGDSSKAEDLLQEMHHLYFMDGNDFVEPDVESFNSVLQAWLRSGSPMTAWRCDGIFKRMQSLSSSGELNAKPNSRTFDLVISALAQDWGAELGKLDSYLSLLKQHYQSGECDCAPTVTSYTEAIKAWCRKDDDPRAFLRAKALLDEMHELAKDGVDSVRPNRNTYEVYLKALSQQRFLDARAELASDVVIKMKENQVDVDEDLRPCLQRCFLPLDHFPSWVVMVDDSVTPQSHWIQ